MSVEIATEAKKDFDNFRKLLEQTENNNEFNIFKILKLEEHEIRHSAFLAWLLDPKASHNLGGKFLELFLSSIGASNISMQKEKNITVKLENFCNSDFETGENSKTKGRIDILIEGESFLCCIENKYGSKEHDDQCQFYKNFLECQSQYKGKEKFYVFLTLCENDLQYIDNIPKDYKRITYKDQIRPLLDELLKEKELATEPKLAIENYKKILEEKTMEKDELETTCNELYSNYKKEIDYIIVNHSPCGAILLAIKAQVEKDGYKVTKIDKRSLKFVTKEIEELSKSQNLEGKVYFEFSWLNSNSDQLKFQLALDRLEKTLSEKWKNELKTKDNDAYPRKMYTKLDKKLIESCNFTEIKVKVKEI